MPKHDYRDWLFRRMTTRDSSRELLHLTYLKTDNGWSRYIPEFTGMTEEEFLRIEDVDTREIDAVFESGNGRTWNYAAVGPIYDPKEKTLRSKWIDEPLRKPPGLRIWLKSALRMPVPELPLERSPFRWMRVSRRRLEKAWASTDSGGLCATRLVLGCPLKKDIRWILPLLERGATHSDWDVRYEIVEVIGEIARVHGYTDERCRAIVERAANDSDGTVRLRATRAADEIKRFAMPR